MTLTEAISLVVNCETQAEVDHFWQKLPAGGQEVPCGWLEDKFGVSWQVVPTVLAAMLKMKKIDFGGLKKAYARASSRWRTSSDRRRSRGAPPWEATSEAARQPPTACPRSSPRGRWPPCQGPARLVW